MSDTWCTALGGFATGFKIGHVAAALLPSVGPKSELRFEITIGHLSSLATITLAIHITYGDDIF